MPTALPASPMLQASLLDLLVLPVLLREHGLLAPGAVAVLELGKEFMRHRGNDSSDRMKIDASAYAKRR